MPREIKTVIETIAAPGTLGQMSRELRGQVSQTHAHDAYCFRLNTPDGPVEFRPGDKIQRWSDGSFTVEKE